MLSQVAYCILRVGLLCLLFKSTGDIHAQQVTPSWSSRVDLESEKDTSEVAEVFRLWKAYLNSRPDSLSDNPYWSKDQKQKYPVFDVAGRFIYTYVTGRYRVWSPHVLSIEPKDGEYEIQTTYLSHDTSLSGQYVWATQSVFAKKEYGLWKLFSPIERNLSKLRDTTVGRIRFLSTIPLRPSEAEGTSILADSLVKYYSLSPPDSIEFVVTRNRNEMFEVLGLSFLLPAPKGFAISNNNQIFSSFGSAWYPHELAHVLFKQFDGTVHPIIREGIATLIGGGSMEMPSYESTLEAARKDMSTDIHLDTVIDNPYLNGTQSIYYATGAWLCKQVLAHSGVKGIHALMTIAQGTNGLRDVLPKLVGLDLARMGEDWKVAFRR